MFYWAMPIFGIWANRGNQAMLFTSATTPWFGFRNIDCTYSRVGSRCFWRTMSGCFVSGNVLMWKNGTFSRTTCIFWSRSPEGIDFQVDGDFEREASDKAVQGLPWIEEKLLLGQPFLGAEVFRQYRRTGRRNDKEYVKYQEKVERSVEDQ